MCKESLRPVLTIDKDVEDTFVNYEWPGNVRELYNVLGRALSLNDGDTIQLSDLPFYLLDRKTILQATADASLRNITFSAEKDAIMDALSASNNNKARAADLLGIHRTLLYKKMKRYKINT